MEVSRVNGIETWKPGQKFIIASEYLQGNAISKIFREPMSFLETMAEFLIGGAAWK